MSLGYYVDQNTLNSKAGQTVMALRTAFDQVQAVAVWLSNHPVVNGVDPLISEFNYTQDEAYVLRLFFNTFNTVRTDNAETFNIGRKITGLE